MKVVDAQFVTSAADARGIPRDGIRHVVFVGRSNVGKSSLINALTRARLARTSAAPGKTRLANLYRIGVEGGPGGPGRWTVYFADLPGYGYARGGAESVAELARIADEYFAAGTDPSNDSADAAPGSTRADVAPGSTRAGVAQGFSPASRAERFRPRIALVLHVIDARHPGLESDVRAAEWLQTLPLARATVANKIDKLSRGERAKNLREVERTLGTAALPVSAERGEGLDDLWALIAKTTRQQQ